MRNIRRTMVAGALALPLTFGTAGMAMADSFSEEQSYATADTSVIQSTDASTDEDGSSFEQGSSAASEDGASSEHTSASTDGEGGSSFEHGSSAANEDGAWSNNTSAGTDGDDEYDNDTYDDGVITELLDGIGL
jgi:hypothetical protein